MDYIKYSKGAFNLKKCHNEIITEDAHFFHGSA